MRVNLASAQYPFATELWGRSIIIPGLDENYDRSIATTATEVDKDKGIPQAFYMHNVMPTAQGYQAVGFDTAIPAMAGPPDDFDKAFPLQSPTLNKFLFSPAVGKNYIYNAVVGTWASISPIAPGVLRNDVLVTTAFLQGETYIYYANYGCFKYDAASGTLVPVVLTGLTPANISGIAAANGYMIAWNNNSVVWSSATVVTDFVPSLITGAGGGQLNDAKGAIVVCLPISGGFIAYCEKNAVGAKYSSNIRFPFIFNEVLGSAGVLSPEQVSWQANLAEHYCWTTAGFQRIDKSGATMLFPELSDFWGNLIFEDFNETTLLFSVQYLSQPVYTKVTAVADRYVVFSYGVAADTFTHALVYDIALKRWGKLKITHRDCFQWNAPNLFGQLTYGQMTMTYGALATTTYGDLLTQVKTEEVPKKTFAFLQQDGTVKIVNFDLLQTVANGVLLLGKFQVQRNKSITHLDSNVENVKNSLNYAMYIIPTYDGKTFQPATAAQLISASPLSRRYGLRTTGVNLSFLFVGAFNLTSYLFNFTIAGEVRG